MTIIAEKGRLSTDQLKLMLDEAEKNEVQDMAMRARIESQMKLKYCANNMIAFTERPEYSSKIDKS